MTTGDPKQAVILAAVAVAVVGFAIFKVIPRGEPPRTLPTSPRIAKSGDAANEKKLPTVVLSNAFWHAKLGEPARPTKTIPNPTTRPKTTDSTKPVSPFGQLPGALSTVENTGIDRQPNGGPMIAVAAIIGTADRREALLSFGNEDLHKARVGTRFGDLTVVAITETSVRIRIGKVEHVIAVGEEKQL